MERLQKVIAQSGYTSRRKAEELILKGKVFVNGKVVCELGSKVSDKDIIEIDGEVLEKEEKEYFLLNKPRGVVTTTSDDKKRKTVVDLIKTDKRIYPVGRLDYDTTGLLLLTNDGEFANIMMHPNDKILKVYVAKIKGIITGEDIRKLKKGVMIDDVKVIPKQIKIKKIDKKTNTSIVNITIKEGKNHEVKRIFDLNGLASGEYRKLTLKEVSKVYSLK